MSARTQYYYRNRQNGDTGYLTVEQAAVFGNLYEIVGNGFPIEPPFEEPAPPSNPFGLVPDPSHTGYYTT